MPVSLSQLVVEHSESGFGIDIAKPRLSFRYAPTDERDWKQVGYELELSTEGTTVSHRADSSESVLVPWPFEPLRSRQKATLRARTFGSADIITPWLEVNIEIALLERNDWHALMIAGPPQKIDAPKRPVRFRKSVEIDSVESARLFATAWGIYDVHINGQRVGDQLLTPGWTSYHHRLAYQMYDISAHLRPGVNDIVGHVAEGWYSGRLGKSNRNVWGGDIGIMLQLEVDGGVVCATDDSWNCELSTDLLESEIYNGEVFETRPGEAQPLSVRTLSFPTARLHSPQAPPVREVMTIRPVEIIVTPTGKRILDFGQNLVGYIRLEKQFDVGKALHIRHAEVMSDGELGTRPLRTAMARWNVSLGGETKSLQPRFTFYGFR